MMKLLTAKNISLSIAGLLIVIQFFTIDKTNPALTSQKDLFAVLDADDDAKMLIISACYDCHSYETAYPWYTNIAPFSWWIADHIEDGRKHLNFSKWSEYPTKKAAHKLEECFEEVAKEKMPLKSYTWAHAEARLTEGQRAKLVTWFKRKKQELETPIAQ